VPVLLQVLAYSLLVGVLLLLLQEKVAAVAAASREAVAVVAVAAKVMASQALGCYRRCVSIIRAIAAVAMTKGIAVTSLSIWAMLFLKSWSKSGCTWSCYSC
jgi:hypothetical protein